TGAAFSLSRIGTFIFLSTFVVLLDAYGAVPVFSINFMFGIIIAAVVFILGPKTTGKVLELISK
ncbi:MAG: MFS transporter, partial [Candidatus Thermoplasmatota archaeon]|nr:MFS transporter [Candidatus Thermoplasmatota archaeon]